MHMNYIDKNDNDTQNDNDKNSIGNHSNKNNESAKDREHICISQIDVLNVYIVLN